MSLQGIAISDDEAIAFNDSLYTNKTLIKFNMSGIITLLSRVGQCHQSKHNYVVKQ